jgi:hypothetical protein
LLRSTGRGLRAARRTSAVGDVIAISILVGGVGLCWLYAVAIERWL